MLMAGLTAMVLPRLSGMYAASERAGERRLLFDDIAALPYAAYAARETFTLTSYPGQLPSSKI